MSKGIVLLFNPRPTLPYPSTVTLVILGIEVTRSFETSDKQGPFSDLTFK